MSYALIAIVATLLAANIATAYQLWRTMRDFAAEMVDLAQSDADLMISRGNEETAIKAARDAADLVDALRASNAEQRSKQDAIETEKINRATDGASLVVDGVSVWQSMPGPTATDAAKRVIEAVQAASAADRDSTRGRR